MVNLEAVDFKDGEIQYISYAESITIMRRR